MARARITNTPHSVSMYILHVHVCGCIILSMMIGVLWWYYRAGDLGGVYQTPCVVFTGHPSLRCGDAVHFMEVWGRFTQKCCHIHRSVEEEKKTADMYHFNVPFM